MPTYKQSKAKAMKKALKSETNARAMAERELKKALGKDKPKAKAKAKLSPEVRKARIAQAKAKARPSAKVYSMKDGLPTGQKKAPKGGDKLSEAAKKSRAKRAAVSNNKAERRASKPNTTAKNVARAMSSKSNVAKAARGVALSRVGSLAGGVGVGVTLGATMAKAGSDLKKMQKTKSYAKDGGIDARIARQKAKSPTASSTGKVSVAPSLRGKSKPAPKKAKQTTATKRTNVAKAMAKPAAPKAAAPAKAKAIGSNTKVGANVQEGPSRKPVKKKKENRGYSNYNRIMSSEGLAYGGVVKKQGGGIISRGFEGMKTLGQAYMQQKQNQSRSKQQINTPKASSDNVNRASSDNQAIKKQSQEQRRKGMYGRELVPSHIMQGMKRNRGG